jgi:hypothetical protein
MIAQVWPISIVRTLVLILAGLLFSSQLAFAQFAQQGPKLVGTGAASPPFGGTWQMVPTPAGGLVNPLLLTDGTVIVINDKTSNWYKLTPDNTGSYVNGTWSQIASLPDGDQPRFFASAVLPDGRRHHDGWRVQRRLPGLDQFGRDLRPDRRYLDTRIAA